MRRTLVRKKERECIEAEEKRDSQIDSQRDKEMVSFDIKLFSSFPQNALAYQIVLCITQKLDHLD
jgi:hypothetical protein